MGCAGNSCSSSQSMKDDNNQNSAQVDSEFGSCLEDRGNTSNLKGNDNKPEFLLSFDPEKMEKKKYYNSNVDTFNLTINDRNPSGEMSNQLSTVHTSWEGCSVTTIKDMVPDQVPDNDIAGAPIRIKDFTHYVKVIYSLIVSWYNKQDRPAIYFLVGKFTVRLRPDDLYSCPIKKGDKEIHVPDKNLCYPKLKTSNCFNKNFAETLWNYIKGFHDKVNKSIQIYGDATALCAVLFSEVIRYPDMFFHNILLMEHIKSWDEFLDKHPMLTGGSFKNQNRESVSVKVREREQQNLFTCAQKIMRDQEKRGNLFL